MRIAQVSPLIESVPPQAYGGTERIVSYLTENLVRMGHEVTLFASADSRTAATLVPMCPTGLRADGRCLDNTPHHLAMVERVFREAHRFDLIHFHVDYVHLPLARRHTIPSLTTLHGRLDLWDAVPCFEQFRDHHFVSISNSQRSPLPFLNWLGTIYHGLPLDEYAPRAETGSYLLFLGRLSPEKGFPQAVEIAKRAGLTLRVAAKADPRDREYIDQVAKPLLRLPHVDYVGEVGQEEKQRLLQEALALVFAIDWPEPFGLVMIEAMACGTPVLARRRGSVPEIIDEGITGIIFESTEEAVQAVPELARIDRRACWKQFTMRFNAKRMASQYTALYERLIDAGKGRLAKLSA